MRLVGCSVEAQEGQRSVAEIYALCDPNTGAMRYIGKAKDSMARLRRHITEAKLNRPVNVWVRGLIAQQKIPLVKVLEVVPDDQWEMAERRLIAHYRKTEDLLNLAEGGAMPSMSKEQRQKAAKATNKARDELAPEWHRFQQTKMNVSRLRAQFMRKGDYWFAYKLYFYMRLKAFESPHLHAEWIGI